MSTRRVVALLLGGALIVSGCGGPSSYQRVFHHAPQPNVREYAASLDQCWPAVTRAVLGLNFSINEASADQRSLEAERLFQDGKRTTTILLRAHLQPVDETHTVVYLTAIETTERIFARSYRRFFLWLVPLPGGGGITAARVTEGARSIDDKRFFAAFFDAVSKELGIPVTRGR